MGNASSKFLEICKNEGLSFGDDALVMKSYIAAFAYKTRDIQIMNIGRLIEGSKKFIVKFEDLTEVLSSTTYAAGGIVIEGFYKKVNKEGGYDLILNAVTEFPAEYPSSLNEVQLVELLKKCKKEGTSYLIDYLEENNEKGLISEVFMYRLTPIVVQMDLKASEMERFEDVRNKINFSIIKKTLIEDTGSLSLLKKAGLK